MAFSRHSRRVVLRAAFFTFVAATLAVPQSDEFLQKSSRGKELMAQGQFEEAIPIYRDLVRAIPNNPGLLLNLAMAEEMAGHPAQAIPDFETVLKAQPDSVPALTSLSMARLQLNQPAEAFAPLKKLIALTPNDANARGMLAAAEMSLGRFNEAAEQYRRLTSLTPSDPKAWHGLGKAYEALAASSFERLVKAAPESGFVAFLVAETRLQRRQYRSAFFFYREAEKTLPGLPGLHRGLADVYSKTGHPDWAGTESKRETELPVPDCKTQPEACQFARGDFLALVKAATPTSSPSSLFWAARAYNELALSAFDRLGHLPDSPEMHVLKAQILHDHGQDLDAASEWRAALAMSPEKNDVRLRTEVATSLFLAHDYQSAMPMIEELLATDPASPDLNFMFGESLWRTQQSEKAIPYLENALRRSPGMLPAHAALGLALVSLNRSEQAIPHLEKAVSLDDDGSLHYSLARAYQSVGDKDRAHRNLEEYERIQRQNAEVNGDLAKEAEITAPGPKMN